MSQMLTLSLARPIAAIHVSSTSPEALCAEGGKWEAASGQSGAMDGTHITKELEQQKAQLTRLCQTVNSIGTSLEKLHRETLAHNRAEIARLAVEITRKILVYKTGKGDYDIQAIVEEALKLAPTRQNIVVRLNPEDLPHCQQLQRESPENPFAGLELTADWSIGRAECVVETPKGIVQSFIEEHLDRIGEALQKVE